MRMLWPLSLLLLGLIPLLITVYLWALRRRRRFAVRYSSLTLVRAALPQRSNLRRHLPFALFLLSLASLVLTLGRPVAVTLAPAGRATVILAVDISRSMLQDDIWPSRLEAAEDAAQSFVVGQTGNTQIGVVAFAGWAQLLIEPTTDQESLQAVLDGLTTGRGTAIGTGIIEALNAIAAVNPNVEPVGPLPEAPIGGPGESNPGSRAQTTPLPAGMHVPDIIVLLTDGVFTTGPFPLDAAQEAVARGVRVYTIGFGTENGSGSSSRSWGNFRRGIDEEMLKEIAAMTGGEYFAATSAGELQKVFESLPTYLITREETVEISVIFAALGALLAGLAVVLALLWHPLP